MKVIVTGGSGQLGTVVLRKLIDDRTVKRLISIDVRAPYVVAGKLQAVSADVRDPQLARHFEGADAVIHLAFIVTRRMARDEMQAINVEGSKNVFRAAAQQRLKTIIYASSIAAYGVVTGHELPLRETTMRRLQPDFPYATHKYLVEDFLDGFEREHPEMRVVRIRPSILIGARMQTPLSKLLGKFLALGYMPATSSAPLPVVWDEDVADAMLLALKNPAARGAFNVSADEAKTATELAATLDLKTFRLPPAGAAAISRIGPVLEKLNLGEAVDPSWQRLSEVEVSADSTKAKTELGWKPKCPTAIDVFRKYLEISPSRTDLRIRAFFTLLGLSARKMLEQDQQQLSGVNARYHLAFTGKGGGDFGMFIENNSVRVVEGIPQPPTSVVTMPATLWLDLLNGRASLSTAQFTGKVRVDGDPLAAFAVGGLISRYKQAAELPGVQGYAARALSRWMAQGGTS